MSRMTPYLFGIACALALGCSLDRAPLGGADAAGLDVPALDAGGADTPPPDDGGGLDVPELDAPELDAGTDTGTDTPIDVPACTMPRCLDAERLEECVAGVPMERRCELGCTWAGMAHCRRVSPTNVDPGLFQDDAPDVMLMADTSWSTEDCGALPRGTMASTGAGEVCVVRTGAFFLRADRVLSITGRRGLVVLATGAVEILGDIDASAHGTTPGPGGGRGGTTEAATGIAIGQPGGFTGEFADGGGGGGGACGDGGDGGTGGTASRGTGGGGSPRTLEPAFGGSGGGRGGRGESAGNGGAGGGSLQITSRVSIRIAGTVSAAGGGGRGGADGTSADANIGAGGGGGSGGGILLESLAIEVTDGTLDVSGGGGGGAASCRTRGDAPSGADGIDIVGPAPGGAAGRACADGTGYGARGADGGGGGFPDAADGFSNMVDGSNGGGGGGGSGCIVFRTPGAAAPAPGIFDANESTDVVRTELVRAID